jgi:flagellar basal body rod protein FlgC
MLSSVDSALSGLSAAGKSLETSASNLANQSSSESLVNGQPAAKPYVPLHVDRVTLSDGGVKALAQPVNPPSITVPDSSSPEGQTQLPNVDTAAELVNISVASYDFKANLKSLKVADNTQKSLLDILS